jgi:hypothetical protein
MLLQDKNAVIYESSEAEAAEARRGVSFPTDTQAGLRTCSSS